MSLIEKWQARVDMVAREAAAHSDIERVRHCEGEENAWQQAIVDMHDACTPRAPKAKWFGDPFDSEGNPTGKWDSWWFSDDNGILRNVAFHRGHYCESCGQQYHLTGTDEREEDHTIEWDSGAKCIPVVRDGFPMAVGWHVVGG